MKKLLISLLVFSSVSAFASVCDVKIALDPVADIVKLSLEDKEQAEEVDGMIISIMGGNPNKVNCEKLIKVIKKSGVRSVQAYPGKEIPLQLIHIINL